MKFEEVYDTINNDIKLQNTHIDNAVDSVISSLYSENASLVNSNNADVIINNVLSYLNIKKYTVDNLTNDNIEQLMNYYDITSLNCNLLEEEVKCIYRLLLTSIYYIQDGNNDELNNQLKKIDSYKDIYENLKKNRDSNVELYLSYSNDYLSDGDCKYYTKGGSNHFYFICEILHILINKYNEKAIVNSEILITKNVVTGKYVLKENQGYFALALDEIYYRDANNVFKDFTIFVKIVLELFDRMGKTDFTTGNINEKKNKRDRKVNTLRTQISNLKKQGITNNNLEKHKKIEEEVRKILKNESIL